MFIFLILCKVEIVLLYEEDFPKTQIHRHNPLVNLDRCHNKPFAKILYHHVIDLRYLQAFEESFTCSFIIERIISTSS